MSRRLDLSVEGRPSRLALGRQLTGEAPLDPTQAEARAAYAAELDAARHAMPPLDLDAVRARAAALPAAEAPGTADRAAALPAAEAPGTADRAAALPAVEAPGGADRAAARSAATTSAPAAPAPRRAVDTPRTVAASRPRRPSWQRAAPLLLAALALLLVLVPRDPRDEGHRAKGGPGLEVYVQRGAEVVRVEPGQALREGDRLRFATRADGHESVVLLSIDGEGRLTLYYPEAPEAPPVPVEAWQRQLLDDAVQLDDAVGPESFVAVYGPASTEEAMALVQAAYAAGGHAALARLATSDPGVAVLTVEKAP